MFVLVFFPFLLISSYISVYTLTEKPTQGFLCWGLIQLFLLASESWKSAQTDNLLGAASDEWLWWWWECRESSMCCLTTASCCSVESGCSSPIPHPPRLILNTTADTSANLPGPSSLTSLCFPFTLHLLWYWCRPVNKLGPSKKTIFGQQFWLILLPTFMNRPLKSRDW